MVASTDIKSIEITGARVHTLKNISCHIPHEKMTVITGPSGSGKSSLAFDTLYAEGQRRYLESLSAYARQFLERIEKPDVDRIDHILPAIALEQKNRVKNARSTVGTATEIDDYMRLLYSTAGKFIVPEGPVYKGIPKRVMAELINQANQTESGLKLVLMAAVMPQEGLLKTLFQLGYDRLVLPDGELHQFSPEDDLDKKWITKNHPIPTNGKGQKVDVLTVLVDRLVIKPEQPGTGNPKSNQRLVEAIEQVYRLSEQFLGVQQLIAEDATTHDRWLYSNHFACQATQVPFLEPFVDLFSFNSPRGACPTCEGFGRVMNLDMDKIVPDRNLSLSEGAIHPFSTPANQDMQEALMHEGKRNGIRLGIPFKDLSEEERQFVMYGPEQLSKRGIYPGIQGFFDYLETKKYKVHVRVTIARYRGFSPCTDCNGARIRPEALNVKLASGNELLSIYDLQCLPVRDLLPIIKNLALSEHEAQLTERVRREIINRLEYLNNVGLGYLTLARQSRTLSGGEAQRIHLATALGSGLTDTLYVLDEPTVGLHARDTDRLLQILHTLRDKGNTVVVVEHDPDMIAGANHILDLGPASGEGGGYVVFEGNYSELLRCEYSLTAQTLRDTSQLLQEAQQHKKATKNEPIQILGARGNNLKNIDVTIPTGQLVCVTGLSGSGKSTLIKQTLYGAYQQQRGEMPEFDAAPCRGVTGLDQFAEVLLVDQSPPGRSARSNPVTYVKAYDEIRQLFASTRKATALGLTASHFSFNSGDGRCDRCDGLGFVKVDMQFMADVTLPCQDCDGKRFKPAVLSVDYHEATIHDVLNMTITDAAAFFEASLEKGEGARAQKVVDKLQPLIDLGLGYLRLGQSTATLSGGESQRLKLASYLLPATEKNQHKKVQPNLFLFDEPTTGLHLNDINTLMQVFRRLVAAGHSLIVIEHNLYLVAQADHVIDLGPEGGDLGGEIVAEGSVETVSKNANSVTGQFLKHLFPNTLLEDAFLKFK